MKVKSQLLLSLVLTLVSSAFSLAEESPAFVIMHVAVIDGTGRDLQLDQTVVIQNKRIVSVGPFASAKVFKNARVIDAHGKFLIPGLWDMHVHIAGLSADPKWSKQTLLPLLLANGITGIRDMGGDLDELLAWKHEVDSGTLLGPHIVAAGPFLVSGGKKSAEQIPVTNADEARAAVRDLKQRGADFIKIISLPSREAFLAVADECAKQQISLVGHLPLQVGALEASNAGMRGIEHLFYSEFALSLSSKEDELRPLLIEAQTKRDAKAEAGIRDEIHATYSAEKAQKLFAILKKNDTWVTPTLTSLDITSHPELWTADDPSLAFIPSPLAKDWRESRDSADAKRYAAALFQGSAGDWKLTGELHRAGVSLLVGSDSLDPYVFPGPSLHQELAELVRAGFTPADAIRAATQGAAQFLHREKDCGTVEPGKEADLVLLGANPLANIENTRKIAAVIRDGRYLDRAALDAMLSKAKLTASEAR